MNLGDDAGTAMTVSWITPADDVRPLDAVVAYCHPAPCTPGPGGAGGGRATATTESYHSAGYKSNSIHHAVIRDLPPSTPVAYAIGDAEFAGTFATPPPAGDASTLPHRITVVGDLGQTEHSASTIDDMRKSNGGVIVHVGDLSYADGDQPRWDAWGRLKQPLSSATPWMVVEGNHEIEYGVGGLDRQFLAYETRFRMPFASTGASPLWYAFTYGVVRVVMLGSYDDYMPDSPQYQWLSRELGAVDRAATPFVIVGLHAPWYNSNKAHQGEGDAMKAAMEKLLLDHGVDALFAGHVHAYERTLPVAEGGKVDERCGIPYIVIGDGGNREGLAGDYVDPTPAWSAFREASYGHGTIDVLNTTHALFQWRRNQDDGAVADAAWIVTRKGRGCE